MATLTGCWLTALRSDTSSCGTSSKPSMDTVFLISAGVGVVAFLLLLLMPAVELRATSAQAASRSDESVEPPP